MKILISLLVLLIMLPVNAYAMHIMEGFLPVKWAVSWWVAIIPFLYIGLRKIKKIVEEAPNMKLMLAMAGAFAFVLSALKLPSVTGSSSHMTGVGLGAILFGPSVMVVLGFIVLLFQAVLLAHGGLTTLGANVISMGLTGPLVAFGLYRLAGKIRVNKTVNVIFAVAVGNIATYTVTAFQLALAHTVQGESVFHSLVKFLGVFAVTQVPLALVDGILTGLVIGFLHKYSIEEMSFLGHHNPVRSMNNE